MFMGMDEKSAGWFANFVVVVVCFCGDTVKVDLLLSLDFFFL